MIHAVDLAAFLVLAALATRRHRHLGTVGPRRQFEKLVGRLGDGDGAAENRLTIGADNLTLVVGVLVGRTGHVAMGERWQWAGFAHLHLGVVEFLFALGDVVSISEKRTPLQTHLRKFNYPVLRK